ncbi:pyrroloquinoline quinone biosynthesis protein PqqE [Acuticoccus sp. I52.16.1]|uniref:pyrroloquinoline quinone biosynthesis protein PqqE n=1 Tax=Acuticoccus sp. I52.16.1 TaxID=2928472 RepID=UPI001FD3EBB0|nr:pyrroloquinoline quinone biosynthesis protein PqqE [Acuticoccus sp. I52.16.1]UOM35128.1 pyrroloquinoline quinone biosynthesis protein PqqE [Acuticoccus sp. I52.16.1]
MSDASTLERPDAAPATATPVLLGLLAEVTHRCPLQCPYCSNPVALEAPARELSVADWGRVFREAAALGALQLHLSGGEPLARRDIVDIVREARAADLYINLITAAVTLTPERADALVEAGVDHVQVSLQDATATGCGDITNMKGAFAKKIAACNLVTERGLPLTLNAVVHRRNLDNVDKMVDLAVELGAHRLEIANTQYYGWALANRAALMPRPEQVEHANAVVEAARERLRGVLAIDYVLPDYYARFPKPCMGGWGQQFLAVAPSGDVLPCHAAASIPDMVFDNVRKMSLAEIWRASPAFERFRGTDWMREPCQSCTRRDEDFGGCRCQAMMVTGDAANTDPVCVLSPHRAALDAALQAALGAEDTPFRWRRYARD